MEIDLRLERLRLETETAALWARLEYLIPDRARVGRPSRRNECNAPPSIGLLAAARSPLRAYGLYILGMNRGMEMSAQLAAAAPSGAADQRRLPGSRSLPQSIAQGEAATRRHITAGIKAGDVDPATGSKILYYHDPMVPGNKFDQPAKSPFMDMMLVPVYAGVATAMTARSRSARAFSRTWAFARRRSSKARCRREVAAVGSIAWNERDQVVVQARATGFVETPVRARHARPRERRASRWRSCTSRVDRGAGRVPVRSSHAGHRPGSVGRWCAPAHASGRE